MTATALSVPKRTIITIATLTAAFMTQLDSTIAVVALPHMQASTSASREQITWVLTSYMVMGAMFTPLTGWLATRFGRRQVMIASLSGFTVASMLCGLAANFEQLILFRLLQGMLGAALLPISQAILLDIHPPEKHGTAMAIWGTGAVIGPIVGPVIGGYLTDLLNWRWIFFINLPFGIAASIGLLLYPGDASRNQGTRLDLVGFALLAMAVGSFQLMLDRGQTVDWFESRETWITAIFCALAFYLFVVHNFTTRNPFVNPALLRDRNYLLGNFYAFILGGLLFGTMAMLPPMLAELMGYPIKLVGLVTAPRGISLMVAMLLVGPLIGRIDSRIFIGTGLLICAGSSLMMAQFSPEMDSWPVILAGIVQGFGGGLMFVPITTVIFTTLAPDLRNEGVALSALIRALSGSLWISVLHTMVIRNAATVQSRLVETVRPDNPAVAFGLPDFDLSDLPGLSGLTGEVVRQALMVGYVDIFWLLFIACLVSTPFVILLRR